MDFVFEDFSQVVEAKHYNIEVDTCLRFVNQCAAGLSISGVGESGEDADRAIERKAINAIVQGSAADIVKAAILLFQKQLNKI